MKIAKSVLEIPKFQFHIYERILPFTKKKGSLRIEIVVSKFHRREWHLEHSISWLVLRYWRKRGNVFLSTKFNLSTFRSTRGGKRRTPKTCQICFGYQLFATLPVSFLWYQLFPLSLYREKVSISKWAQTYNHPRALSVLLTYRIPVKNDKNKNRISLGNKTQKAASIAGEKRKLHITQNQTIL